MTPGQMTSEPQAQTYGWRPVCRTTPDGKSEVVDVPLTLEDVLHPQEGDTIPESPQHLTDRLYITSVCQSRLDLLHPLAVVNSDLLTNLGLVDERAVSPDVSVYYGLRQPRDPAAGTFYPKQVEAHCLFHLEIVSPSTRTNDVARKLDLYFRAGVPLYILIDQENEDAPRRLVAWQHGKRRYYPAAVDSEGRLHLPLLNLALAVRNDRAVFYDLETNEELGDYADLARKLEHLSMRDGEREEEMRLLIERHRITRGELSDEVAKREQAEKDAKAAVAKQEEAEKDAKAAVAEREKAEQELAELRRLVALLQGGNPA